MRIRQVKGEFWRDEKLADLTPFVRLTYIGLWMIADDAGWFRYNLSEIGVDLYPYEERRVRQENVASALSDLEEIGRVVTHECGHAFLPNLVKHQRLSSPEKRVTTVEKEHRSCVLSRGDVESRGDSQTLHEPPTRNGTVRNGKERKGTGGTGGMLRFIDGEWVK